MNHRCQCCHFTPRSSRRHLQHITNTQSGPASATSLLPGFCGSQRLEHRAAAMRRGHAERRCSTDRALGFQSQGKRRYHRLRLSWTDKSRVTSGIRRLRTAPQHSALSLFEAEWCARQGTLRQVKLFSPANIRCQCSKCSGVDALCHQGPLRSRLPKGVRRDTSCSS